MTWKHRQNKSWQSPTVKKRKDGQWETISGGGGAGGTIGDGVYSNGYYLPSGDPPTRSNTIYTSNYSSLQSALNSLSPDTRLVIDTGGGSISGNWEFPSTPHITLDGNGTTLVRSDKSDQILNGATPGGEYTNDTNPVGTYSRGQQRLRVSSTSLFSPGDIIRVYDPNQVLMPDMQANSGANEGQGEYHVVDAVDSGANELVLEEALLLPYNDPSGTLEVQRVDFKAIDQRITNTGFDGRDLDRTAGERLIMIRRRKDFWFDNCRVEKGRDGLWIWGSYRVRIHNSDFADLGSSLNTPVRGRNYPIDITDGTAHTLITDCSSVRSQRYAYKSGSGGTWWPCRNGRMVNCYAADTTGRRAYDQHPGSFNWDYFDCVAENDGFARPRSRGFHEQGTEVINPSQNVHYIREYASQYSAEKELYRGDMGNHVAQVYVYHDMDYLRFTDVWAKPNGSLNSFLRFRHDESGTFDCDELIIDHVAENGNWLTEDRFWNETSFSGSWDFPGTNNPSFNHPTDGTTPAEYFGQKYGW